MADGAGAGAGVDGTDDLDSLLDDMQFWGDTTDKLLRVYDIIDRAGNYNRHCFKGIVPDEACKLLPDILVDERDRPFLAK